MTEKLFYEDSHRTEFTAKVISCEEAKDGYRVKQRIIETIIQINRTHTLPAYGLLLVGPAGIYCGGCVLPPV